MKTLEELKLMLEVFEQIEPQSIKEIFEKIQNIAEIRKQIKEIEGGANKWDLREAINK